ncbi:MAG TPA: DinB family protein [Ideonella sp.]|uniref:DinB family protein n=1 Tax=Ideonella sp. TaxID=1929293 RepID=UPI002E324821|nr:DinB family protein [Ideonella sp.]HEX5684599.1 DinB family protein [Ideonella sp.]
MQEQLYSALLGSLQEMPGFLRHALGGLPPEVLLRKPANDKSHLLEHLWHTRDCDDDLYGLRIRRILAEERPSLKPVDVDAWPRDRGYESRSGDQAIAEFESGRARLLSELKGLSPEQLARVGVRADGSEVSVLDVIQQLARHDQDHRWRITAILRGFAGLAAPAEG